VPTNIQNKVIKWFDYLWLTQKSSDEERAVSCLPGEWEKYKYLSHLMNDDVLYVHTCANAEMALQSTTRDLSLFSPQTS